MQYKTIDLCAGIGGIRKGFELTGHYYNVISAEIDKYACTTYKHLYNEDPFNDITSEAFKKDLENIEYDVLLAGFPCQTFSRAGLELGFEDKTKGTIFYHIAEIIQRTRPKGIFLENVDNLVRHNKGDTFKSIVYTLERQLDYKIVGVNNNDEGELEYEPKSFVRNTKYFGLPQNRPRTYIVAFDRSFFGDKVSKIDNELPQKNNLKIYKDLHELLELGADKKYYMSSGYLETLEKHKVREKNKGNGFGYRIVNEKSIKSPVANTIMATGGSGKERNLVYDPQEGIAGEIVPTKKSALNSKGIRVMTPKEWGKLQGFINYAFMKDGEDRFSFPKEITNHQQYKQFGNTVSIPVIETMAEYMFNCFKTMYSDDSQSPMRPKD